MRIQLKNKTKENKIQPCGTAKWPSQAWSGFWRRPEGEVCSCDRSIYRSLSLELEGNATVSNRKREGIWQTVVDCSFNACSQNSPSALVLPYVRYALCGALGQLFPFPMSRCIMTPNQVPVRAALPWPGKGGDV